MNRHLEILKAICNLPTAPYREQHVVAWLLAWAKQRGRWIHARRDKAGNVYLEYRRGGKKRAGAGAPPLVIEAHMDHPGFVVTGQKRSGEIEAEFRGSVRPSHFKNTRAKFWIEGGGETKQAAGLKKSLQGSYVPIGKWLPAKVQSVKQVKGQRSLNIVLRLTRPAGHAAAKLPPGTLGMWDLPDAAVKENVFAARVCDDLGGIAAIVCLLEELIRQKVGGHIIGLCTRAEEVGFSGVLAVCENGWIPKKSPVIGLETSKAMPTGGIQGNGAIIRVGDTTGLFSAGLTHFLSQTAGHIADADSSFRFQRKLMDGGTCNSTAFTAWGYDSAAMCVGLGNYHNMTIKGETGWHAKVGGKAGPGIASETIDFGDFSGMVRILVETAKRIHLYKPGLGDVRQRLTKMHHDEQIKLLYQPIDA